MTRSLSGKRHKVKRNHTLDRRRGFVTPSASDVQCPFFEHTWAYFKDKGYLPDFVPTCTNHTADCDYQRNIVPNQFSLCHRYIKEDNDGFTPVEGGIPETGARQGIDLEYHLRRLFRDKEAVLQMRLAKYGTEWRQLFGTGLTKPFTMNPSGTIVPYTEASNSMEIKENHSFLSGMMVKAAPKLQGYSFQFTFYVKPTSTDNDAIVAVFNYDEATKNYYSLEWNEGGWEPQGLSIRKHICVNKDTLQYESTTLYHDPNYYWIRDNYDAHLYQHLYFTISETTAHIHVDRPHWHPKWWHGEPYNHWHGGYYTWERKSIQIPLNDTRIPPSGKYGVGSISQIVTFGHFYGHTEVHSGYEYFSKRIGLSPLSVREEGGRILSTTLESIFKPERDAYLRVNSLSRDELTEEVYSITYDNVTEPIVFSDGLATTKDPSQKVIIKTWDYDRDIVYKKHIDLANHTPVTVEDHYTIAKDAFVQSVKVNFNKMWMDDGFDLTVDSHTLYSNPILHLEYKREFTEIEMHARTDGFIDFIYEVKRDPITFYYNERHIDSHDKRYRIKGNIEGWHADDK